MALAGPTMNVPPMTHAEVTQILKSAGFLSAKEEDELIDCHLGQFCSPQRTTPARILESILDKLGMNEETESRLPIQYLFIQLKKEDFLQ